MIQERGIPKKNQPVQGGAPPRSYKWLKNAHEYYRYIYHRP